MVCHRWSWLWACKNSRVKRCCLEADSCELKKHAARSQRGRASLEAHVTETLWTRRQTVQSEVDQGRVSSFTSCGLTYPDPICADDDVVVTWRRLPTAVLPIVAIHQFMDAAPELSMGPFCVTRSNPTQQLTDPTHYKWENLDPTQYN